MRELAARDWDVIVVGGGHNGLAAAAYLARARLRETGFSEEDIRGWAAYEDLYERLRRLLRHEGHRDAWVGSSPERSELEEMLGHDDELISVLFEESIADTLSRHIADERLRH